MESRDQIQKMTPRVGREGKEQFFEGGVRALPGNGRKKGLGRTKNSKVGGDRQLEAHPGKKLAKNKEGNLRRGLRG